MEKLRLKFLKECAANLELIGASVAAAGEKSAGGEALENLFRGAHSIKGGAGFFGLDRLGWLAAAMEDVCGELVSGTLAMSDHVAAELRHAAQILADLVEASEAGIELVEGYELTAGNRMSALCRPA